VGSSPNRYLLEGLAEMGRGDVIYQRPGRPVSDSVDRFYARIAHPAMSHVQIDWGGLAVTEQYPTRIPDLWAGEPVRVVARYEAGIVPVDADGSLKTTVRISGWVGKEQFEVDLPLDVPDVELGHEAVAKLWARRKMRDLEWYPRGRSASALRQAVLDVALDHGLMSKYTSLVAIDDRPSACGTAALTVEVPHEAPAYTAASQGGLLGSLGSGGIGSRGSGFGGGGMAKGLSGIGTKGGGYGRSGYGSGGGHFGSKAGGGIGMVGGDPIILGSIDRTLIDEVIKRHMNQIRYCYQRELTKNPSLGGKVTIKFVIVKDGSVSNASTKSTTMNNSAVENCVAERFKRFQFPEPQGGGIVIVTYPFIFSGS
jgi:Ca-activated chloride channel family protein